MHQAQQVLDVELKIPTENDLQFIRRLWSDPETMQPVGGPIHMTNEQAKGWFDRMIDPGTPTDCYRLILNNLKQPVGEISFHRLNLDDMAAEFNIKVASKHRGKGYAKKAMLLFLDFFFNQCGGRVLIDDVALNNSNGQNALLHFGFEHDPNTQNVFRLIMTREQYHYLYHP